MKRIDTFPAERSLKYLAWVSHKPECCITLRRDGLVTMHVVHVGLGGDRKKPNPRHFTTLRVHHTVHTDHHSMTSKEFSEKYGVDLWEAVGKQLLEYFPITDWKSFAMFILESREEK